MAKSLGKVSPRPKRFLMEFLHKVISTKMCTCLWLKWGHAIPHRAKAKKAVALCPLGSRHDLHWSREKGNEIFASPAFQIASTVRLGISSLLSCQVQVCIIFSRALWNEGCFSCLGSFNNYVNKNRGVGV